MADDWVRTQFAYLRHNETGEVVVVDQFRVRMDKMKMRIMAWSSCVAEYGHKNKIVMYMIGLTYRGVGDYDAGDIRKFMKRLKQRYGKDLLAWAWVSELQERGAVHYHILIVLPKGVRYVFPDKAGDWKHGTSSVIKARSAFYLFSYVKKKYQKDLANYPKGCRLYATSIRFGGDEVKQKYRRMAGLVKYKNEEESEWTYLGQEYILSPTWQRWLPII